jgi:3',5'-cyclic AMP phosphodiesterase CpdA
MPDPSETRYVELIHLSDLHFGQDHRFAPEVTPAGAKAIASGYPDLADSLVKDLSDPANEPPRPRMGGRMSPGTGAWDVPAMAKLFCISGDFTTTGSNKEFAQATAFVKKLTQMASEKIKPLPVGLVVCPGNHDLAWNEEKDALKWQAYANFLNAIYGHLHEPDHASRFGGVKIFDEIGVLVLSLNSEIGVSNSAENAYRGDLTDEQLDWAEAQLNTTATKDLRSYIKVAMVHHHPILIPSLAEPGRSYDAIHGAQKFLPFLHRYGFHVILHGHKHYPHTFHENVRNAFERTDEHSLVVVAGGSCGSRGLPLKPGATQTYNRVRIHWSPDQGSTRIQVVTRGLVSFRDDGTDLLASQWYWKPISTDDRYFLLGRRTRVPSPSAMNYEAPSSDDKGRQDEYRRTRGNFPVAEIKPSLLPSQTNEVLLRIVRHGVGSPWRSAKDEPVAVTWSAGPKFPRVTIVREQDPDFCAVFAYYGSALMQAEIKFEDGSVENAFIYAPMLPAAIPAGGVAEKAPKTTEEVP